jgi:Amidohydrolase family
MSRASIEPNAASLLPNLPEITLGTCQPYRASIRLRLRLKRTSPDSSSPQLSAAERLTSEKLFQEEIEIVGLLRRAGVPLMTGTNCPTPGAYPGFSVHDDLALLVRAGLTTGEALRAATLNPALFLKMEDKLGTIAPGKPADLALLDADPLRDIHNTTKIRAVIADGRLFDRTNLDNLLQNFARTHGTNSVRP